MSVLSQAKEHYKSQIGGELKSIEVPEWNTTVYFRTASNFLQEQTIIKLHQEGKMAEALVETLIQKALDADGKRIFTQADRDVLLREVDPNVIITVCTAINNKGEIAEEDLGN